MGKFIHKILYRTLPLEGYLRAVSRLFFLWQRLGIGREAPATEYVYHLPKLVRAGDTCIDIGANLGYYARTISRLAGPAGKVYAVEPVAPIRKVLSRNLRRCANTEILPYALGTESKPIVMANDSARETGYFGTAAIFLFNVFKNFSRISTGLSFSINCPAFGKRLALLVIYFNLTSCYNRC